MIVKHSGKLGDIIYALPVCRTLNAKLVINPGVYLPETEVLELIEMLHYAAPWLDVELFQNHNIDIDLDQFRNSKQKHIIEMYDFATKVTDLSPWLTCKEPIHTAPIVVNRILRNPTSYLPWKTIKNAVFVGLEEEYKNFPGDIPYHKTKTKLELFKVIAGSQLVVCNQDSLK